MIINALINKNDIVQDVEIKDIKNSDRIKVIKDKTSKEDINKIIDYNHNIFQKNIIKINKPKSNYYKPIFDNEIILNNKKYKLQSNTLCNHYKNTYFIIDKNNLDFNSDYEIYKFIPSLLFMILIVSLAISVIIKSKIFSKKIKKYFQNVFYNFTNIENITEEKKLKIKNKKYKKIKNQQENALKQIFNKRRKNRNRNKI